MVGGIRGAVRPNGSIRDWQEAIPAAALSARGTVVGETFVEGDTG